MKTIRVGIIRCDLHASWYALLMAKADERLILDYWPECHHYFYYRHYLRFGLVGGFALAKVWDEDRRNAEKLSKAFLDVPQICDSFQEVSDDVDLVFIADCSLEGKDHLTLARPGLEKGVVTFVDKPFAYTLADARSMVALAEQNKTALMSASLLRMNPLGDQFRARFTEIAPVAEGVVKGKGLGGLNSTIHPLSLAQHIFGEGVESVQCMGRIPLEFVHLHYPSSDPKLPHGIDVLVIASHLLGPYCGCRCEAYSERGAIHSEWIDDYKYPLGGKIILEKIKQMVRVHHPVLPYASILELIEIVEAARISQREGRLVHLHEVRGK